MRADQKIGGREDQIGQRESAAKTEAVSNRSAEDRKEPDHAAEDAGERAGLFGGEIQLFLQIDG